MAFLTGEDIDFSIVVPTYNRMDRLAALLQQLVQLDYSHERFEVLLVDDGGDAPLEPLVSQFGDRLNITLLRQNHGGVARGRQTGAEAARGKFLAFTDDDCLPARDWLRKLQMGLGAAPNCATGGRTENALPGNPYSTASQALTSYLYAHLNADPRHAFFFANNNIALPRALYLKAGGLDTSWPMCGEDRDLCARWLDHGYPLIYAPDAVVHHAHELTFAGFWRQHFNYGRGAHRFRKIRARVERARIEFEPLSFYLKIPLAAFEQARGVRGFCIAALLVVSQVANTAGFIAERIKPKEKPPIL